MNACLACLWAGCRSSNGIRETDWEASKRGTTSAPHCIEEVSGCGVDCKHGGVDLRLCHWLHGRRAGALGRPPLSLRDARFAIGCTGSVGLNRVPEHRRDFSLPAFATQCSRIDQSPPNIDNLLICRNALSCMHARPPPVLLLPARPWCNQRSCTRYSY